MMQKNYKFNEDKGCYEFCGGRTCELQEQVKEGDSPHKICCGCIEEYEGEAPNIKDLKGTLQIRKERVKEGRCTFEKGAMIDLLKSFKATVVFEKKDGTERTMECTLLEKFLPKRANVVDDDSVEYETHPHPELITVWDLEKKGWRAFKLNTVKSFKVA